MWPGLTHQEEPWDGAEGGMEAGRDAGSFPQWFGAEA